MTKTIIRFLSVNRKTRETRSCWVSGARFADGPGYVVKSVRTTFNKEEAASFSTSTAFTIAAQFCQTPAVLELRDGTVLESDTQALLAEQLRRRGIQAQFRAEMNAFFADMPADLRTSILKALQ